MEALVQRGRMRWKIENEGFNTQKRQGHHLEHQYSKDYRAIIQISFPRARKGDRAVGSGCVAAVTFHILWKIDNKSGIVYVMNLRRKRHGIHV